MVASDLRAEVGTGVIVADLLNSADASFGLDVIMTESRAVLGVVMHVWHATHWSFFGENERRKIE